MTSLTCFDPKKWIWSSHVIAENRSFWLKSTGKTRGANEHHTHTGEREKGEKDHSPGGFDLKWQMLMERADATANFHYFLCVDLLTENVPGWKEWAYGFLCGRRNGCSNNVIQKYLTPFFSVSATLLTHYWLYKTDVTSIYCKFTLLTVPHILIPLQPNTFYLRLSSYWSVVPLFWLRFVLALDLWRDTLPIYMLVIFRVL